VWSSTKNYNMLAQKYKHTIIIEVIIRRYMIERKKKANKNKKTNKKKEKREVVRKRQQNTQKTTMMSVERRFPKKVDIFDIKPSFFRIWDGLVKILQKCSRSGISESLTIIWNEYTQEIWIWISIKCGRYKFLELMFFPRQLENSEWSFSKGLK